MKTKFANFVLHEDGAVTVEWVVLTAAIVGLTVSAYTTINQGSNAISGNTDTALSSMVVGSGTLSD